MHVDGNKITSGPAANQPGWQSGQRWPTRAEGEGAREMGKHVQRSRPGIDDGARGHLEQKDAARARNLHAGSVRYLPGLPSGGKSEEAVPAAGSLENSTPATSGPILLDQCRARRARLGRPSVPSPHTNATLGPQARRRKEEGQSKLSPYGIRIHNCKRPL